MPEFGARPDRPIVLVGLMGSGKSSVGPRLAERLDVPFVDADREIELEAGLTVAEIFERFGEPFFRSREREIMIRAASGAVCVIASGGGAFVDPAIRRHVLEHAVAIWLDAEPAALAARVGSAADRPLLRDRDPARTLAELAARRNPAYAEAHHRIDTGPLTPDEVVERILSLLTRRAPK